MGVTDVTVIAKSSGGGSRRKQAEEKSLREPLLKVGLGVLIVGVLAVLYVYLPKEETRKISNRTGALHVTRTVCGITIKDAVEQTEPSRWVAAQGITYQGAEDWVGNGGSVRGFFGAKKGKVPSAKGRQTVQIFKAMSQHPRGKELLALYYGYLDDYDTAAATVPRQDGYGQQSALLKATTGPRQAYQSFVDQLLASATD